MILLLLFQNPLLFLVWIFAILFGITVHEFGHAAASYALGDHTAKDMGRLSFNPFVHLDLFGFFFLLVAGFGWGKPVPFNPYNLRSKKYGTALVALAGPLVNLLSIVVMGLLFKLIIALFHLGVDNYLLIFLVAIIQMNIVLLVFNLLPVPPLDGSQILFSLLPYSMGNVKMRLQQNGPWILLALIFIDRFAGLNIFSRIFGFFLDTVFRLIA